MERSTRPVLTLAVIVDLWKKFGLRHPKPRTEMTMTNKRMALIELAEKQADSDLVRDMLAYAADRITEVEVGLRTGAGRARARRCARSSATAAGNGTGTPVRGGSRWRSPATPGGYLPSFLEPRRTAEKALVAVILKAYVQGISTRGR